MGLARAWRLELVFALVAPCWVRPVEELQKEVAVVVCKLVRVVGQPTDNEVAQDQLEVSWVVMLVRGLGQSTNSKVSQVKLELPWVFMLARVMVQSTNNEVPQVQLELPWEPLFLPAVREEHLLKKLWFRVLKLV